MAINTTTRQTTAFTSGQTFAFAFKVYEESDVKVIRITNSTGAEEVLTITTHYTVSLNDDQNANPGGSITLVSSGSPVNLGSGFSIVITSKVQPLQQTEITNQGGFFPEVINDVLDKAAILDQQQQSVIDKTIRFPLTQTVGGLEITENAANRANKTLVFDGSGDLSVSATVDGRDVSADGAKLDTIETNAKDDQTAAEIRALVESASDSNVFTDADHTKLNGIEAGATGDLTASEIKALYEGNSNTNVLSDAQVSKLAGIEAGATGDQSASEIRTLVESASDSNVFTDNDHNKLDGIETGATADQTSGDIKTLLQSDKLTHLELANDSVRVSQIQDSQITAAKLDPSTVITASEQASATPNDTSFLTSAAADARFFNISTGDTIKDGQAFPDNDTTIATTAAINDRIIDLVDDVGGFIPIASETNFPGTNPDINNGDKTLISIQSIGTTRTPVNGTVTIPNGAGSNTVTITGCGTTVLEAGYGAIVETSFVTHTYAFHRLVPKATEVTTVASKATEIARLGTADAVADMAILGTTDVVADLNMLATTDIVADMALLATTDVIADMALLAVTDVISDMNDLATSANITAMANCSNSISSINNASSNLNSINNFGDRYQVAANDPTTDGGGNSLAEGDLYFNTSANRLKVYDGSSWVNGVEISGAGAVTTGNTFTGDNRYNDGVKALFGTGSDLEVYHNGTNSHIDHVGDGDFFIRTIGTGDKDLYLRANNDVFIKPQLNENGIAAIGNGAVELYYDNVKRFETTSTGAKVSNALLVGPSYTAHSYADDLIVHNAGDNCGITIAANSAGRSSIFFADAQDSDIGFMEYNHSANRFRLYVNDILGFQITDDTTVSIGKGSWGGNSQVKVFGNTGSVKKDGLLVLNATASVAQRGGGISVGGNTERIASFYCKKDTATDSDGGNAFLESVGDLTLNVEDSETGIDIHGNGSVDLYYDNSKKLETNAQGIVVSGDINLTFANGYSLFADQSGNIFRLGDSIHLQLGNAGDLKLYHDGSNSVIHNNTGNLYILGGGGAIYLRPSTDDEHGIVIAPNAQVELYHNGIKTAFTDVDQWIVHGRTANSGMVEIASNQGANNNDRFRIHKTSASSTLSILNYTSGAWESNLKALGNGAIELYYDNSKKLETTGYGVLVSTNSDIRFASGNWTGEGTKIQHTSGYLYIQGGSNGMFFRTNAGQNVWVIGSNGYLVPNTDSTYDIGTNTVRVRNGYFDTLYGDGSNLTGINTDLVSDTSPQLGGDLDANGNNIAVDGGNNITIGDSGRLRLGNSNDLDIYHHNTNSFIENTQGALYITTATDSIQINKSSAEYMATFVVDGAISLYYDNAKKFETTSTGNQVTGDIRFVNSSWTGEANDGKIQNHGGVLYIQGGSHASYPILIRDNGGTDRWGMTQDGHFVPVANNTYDLGSTSYRVRNIYTNDLNLSNEGGANDVDGTWGSYTIQEGAEDLFLINKRNGKKYKFALMEVS